MASSEYWKKREEAWAKEREKNEKTFSRRLQETYQMMLDEIDEQVNAWYQKYADAEGMTMAQAKQHLTATDIASYARLPDSTASRLRPIRRQRLINPATLQRTTSQNRSMRKCAATIRQ